MYKDVIGWYLIKKKVSISKLCVVYIVCLLQYIVFNQKNIFAIKNNVLLNRIISVFCWIIL